MGICCCCCFSCCVTRLYPSVVSVTDVGTGVVATSWNTWNNVMYSHVK